MHEPDFWTNSAEAMELTIEGNRLLAREAADLLHDLWRRLPRWSDGSFAWKLGAPPFTSALISRRRSTGGMR